MRDEVIEVVIQQGVSKDTRYDFYPYWRLRVGAKLAEERGGYIYITVTPTRQELYKLLESIFVHEHVVDRLRRKKKPDLKVYQKEMLELEKRVKQRLDTLVPSKIYTEYQHIGYNEVLWSSNKNIKETKKEETVERRKIYVYCPKSPYNVVPFEKCRKCKYYNSALIGVLDCFVLCSHAYK